MSDKNIVPLIAGEQIRMDSKGRVCINDLHKAAGGESRHQPSNWLANQQTKELIAELTDPGIPGSKPVSVVKGGTKQGTYACKELVYAYAMWISPAFHIKVIRAYDAMISEGGDWRRKRHTSIGTNKAVNQMLHDIREELGKKTESHHYINEARMVNYALTGKFEGIDRDTLPISDLDLLAKLETRNTMLLARGLDYATRKEILLELTAEWRKEQTPRIPSLESKLLVA